MKIDHEQALTAQLAQQQLLHTQEQQIKTQQVNIYIKYIIERDRARQGGRQKDRDRERQREKESHTSSRSAESKIIYKHVQYYIHITSSSKMTQSSILCIYELHTHEQQVSPLQKVCIV